jgi:hypothetical protein
LNPRPPSIRSSATFNLWLGHLPALPRPGLHATRVSRDSRLASRDARLTRVCATASVRRDSRRDSRLARRRAVVKELTHAATRAHSRRTLAVAHTRHPARGDSYRQIVHGMASQVSDDTGWCRGGQFSLFQQLLVFTLHKGHAAHAPTHWLVPREAGGSDREGRD